MATDEPDLVDVLWERPEPVDEERCARIHGWARKLLRELDLADRELSVVLVDDARIAELKRAWMGEEGPTDVLSFPQREEGPSSDAPEEPIGDVVLSLETAARQAARRGAGADDELRFLLIHALGHLLGHDHATDDEAWRMRALEDRLLAALDPTATRPPTPY